MEAVAALVVATAVVATAVVATAVAATAVAAKAAAAKAAVAAMVVAAKAGAAPVVAAPAVAATVAAADTAAHSATGSTSRSGKPRRAGQTLGTASSCDQPGTGWSQENAAKERSGRRAFRVAGRERARASLAHACRISGSNDVVFSSRRPLAAGTVAALAGVAANRIA